MDNNEVGKINLGVNLTSPGMQSQITGMASMASKFAKKAFAVVGTAMGVASITSFAKSCLELGSNLTEVQNVVNTTFGSMANSVNNFALNAMEAFGMSETVAKKYMGTFGAMSKAMGLSTKQSYDMAEAVTGLTGDVASFFNLSTDEAYTKLKSIWTGETETLKDLGVIMTQTALDQYALNNGFGKTTAKMTEQEKLMLRYQYVMSTLSDASGDFAKTSKTWANQTRVLSLRFDALKASIGQGLINVLTPVLVMINNLLAGLQKVADGFSKLTSMFTGNKKTASGILGISDAADSASDSISNIGSAASGAAKEANRAVAGFDKLNIINSNNSSGGGGGGSSSLSESIDTEEFGKQSERLTSFERLVGRLKDSFSDSFNQMGEAAKSFGTTIKENLSGGFKEWMDEDGPRVVQLFNEIITHGSNMAQSIADFATAFSDVFSVFSSPDAINITGNLISILEDGFYNSVLLASKFADDLIDTITSPFVENKDVIKEGLAGIIEPLSSISDKLKESTQKAWDTVQDAYDKYIKPAFSTVKEIWTKYLGSNDFQAHMASMKESLQLIDDSLQPILDAGQRMFAFITGSEMASMSNGISVFGNLTLSAFKLIISSIDQALKNFLNMVQFVSALCNGGWKNAMLGMANTASSAVSAIKNAFVGIPNWFEQTFSRAWSKVQQVFSKDGKMFVGIQDGISAAFKRIVNNLIAGLNSIIRVPFNKINTTLNKIRTIKLWDITPFSTLWSQNPISVPSIPYLAKGGIIKQPTLAMIGESGKEAVMPLENNDGWIEKLAEKIASKLGGDNTGKGDTTVTVVLEGDAKKLFKVVKKEADEFTRTTGEPAFST